MKRRPLGVLLGLLLVADALPAQEDIQRGKIKKIDADKDVVTLTVGEKDLDFRVTEKTRSWTPRTRTSRIASKTTGSRPAPLWSFGNYQARSRRR